MTRLTKLFLGGISLIGLSACGLQGDLTRPDPLFGNPDEVPEAERPDRTVTDGMSDLREADREDDEDTPDPEDELLGGPGS
ncbi:MAG: hypothetical protein MRY64_12495 [Hyphomonadaceae bacterium]|nr:hypothetical protein [Hyphomonadaceae bacterium]